MDRQHAKLECLESELRDLRTRLREKKDEVAKEVATLQTICGEETGHEFVSEPNWDYHNVGKYYRCTRCDFVTAYGQDTKKRARQDMT